VAVVVVVEETSTAAEVVEHIHNLVEDYAFVVENNIVAVEEQIQVKDHMMDFVGNHKIEMDEHQYSIQLLYHHIHNEHYYHTLLVVVVVAEEDHAFVLVVDEKQLPFVVEVD
jgi:hypothetical protein